MKTSEMLYEGIYLITETLSDGSEVFGIHIGGAADFDCVDLQHALRLADALGACTNIFIGLEGV